MELAGLDGTCAEWFRGRDMALPAAAFARRWGHGGVLCAVLEGAAGPQLHVRFSLAHPVPGPLAPPAEPADLQDAAGGHA